MSDSAKTARLAMFTVDCADPAAEAAFWSGLLGWQVVASDADYAMLSDATGPALGFGRVDDYEAPAWPNERGSKQFHLDLAAADPTTLTERAIELGATRAEPQPGETWVVLLDPAGHPFCITDETAWS